MKFTKKEGILIFVTVVLVIVMGIGFYYDRTSALLDRTNAVPIASDPNLQLEKINKAGFLFARQYYEARFRIADNDYENYINVLSIAYGGGGGYCNLEGYKDFAAKALPKSSLKPDPKSDSIIWIMGSKLGKDTEQNVVYIIDQENMGTYLYVYYSRK